MRRHIICERCVPRVCLLATGLLTGLIAAIPAVRAQRTFGRPPVVRPGQNSAVYPPRQPGGTAPAALAKDSKTIVSIELITNKNGAGAQAQLWRPVFEQLGVNVRIRQGLFNDKIGVTETQTGPLRMVKVTAELDRTGRITLPRKTFTRANAAALGEYLRDLQTFGEQGNPDGQPLWGLNKKQFDAVYKTLSVRVDDDVHGKPLAHAVTALKFPATTPTRFSLAASKHLTTSKLQDVKVRQSVTNFSKGTALALVLNEYGLGFQPTRTPEGGLELLIEPQSRNIKVWPLGWEPKDTLQRTAPKLYTLVPVELNDLSLPDVLHAISIKTDVPIRFDYYRIEAQKIDVAAIRVSHPYRKTSWSLLLRGVTNPHRLTRDLRIDELGQPLVLITTVKVGKFGQEP